MEEKGLVKIQTESGELTLSPAIVRRYLVSGNGTVSDQEVMMFLGLCRYQRLNPFLREAYLVKYGSQPATIITGKDAFMRRAMKAKDCRGFKAGVIVQQKDEVVHTDGIVPPGSRIIGGWSEVYRDGWQFPIRVEVAFDEYVGRKNDGTPNRMWQEKPATMIRKVALVQALREAFPDDLSGMYSPEEVSNAGDLPVNPVPVDPADANHAVVVESLSPASPINGTPPPQPEAPAQQAPRGRRRANKFPVEPESWNGTTELATCGVTPDQIRALQALSAAAPDNKTAIMAFLQETTGYEQLSFLRADEAEELLARFAVPVPSAAPAPANHPAQSLTTPTDLIECPMRPGDRLSVSQYCHQACQTRAQQGWCPICGDEPPATGGLI